VPEKSFIVELDYANPGLDRLRVRMVKDRGRLTFFSAQYEANRDDRWYAVVRYDASHGTVHRDLSRSFWLQCRHTVVSGIDVGAGAPVRDRRLDRELAEIPSRLPAT
jgi:hypothetical protein